MLRLRSTPAPQTTRRRDSRTLKAGQHIRPKDIETQPKILGFLPARRL
jgi:hypothetical protein